MLDVPHEQRYLRAETASRSLPRFASPPYDGTTETAQLAREVTGTEASERFLTKSVRLNNLMGTHSTIGPLSVDLKSISPIE